MPCIAVPEISIPSLPAPFSFGASQPPSVSFDPELCCKIIQFPLKLPPLPLPPGVLNPAFITAMNAAKSQVTAFIRSLSFNCPRN